MLSKIDEQILNSNLISRDLSWIQFNHRVLDQARKPQRNFLDRLKFIAITASNADEFFMIRVGSLYNYIDFGNERVDYSGLKSEPFRVKLLDEYKKLHEEQQTYFSETLIPLCNTIGCQITSVSDLSKAEKEKAYKYFERTLYPMLTPMLYDQYHSFPILVNNVLTFGVVTRSGSREKRKMSFVQIPQNLPRFFELYRKDELIFIPIESIIREHISEIFKNVEVISCTLFRLTRNGDFTLEESEDIEANFLDEIKKKLKTRKTGRVVRMEVEENYDQWLIRSLFTRYRIDEKNLMSVASPGLIDFTGLWQIVNHADFKDKRSLVRKPIPPLSMVDYEDQDMFKILRDRDILLHQPYNSMEPLLDLLEQAAEDPHVLSIKLTIYRLAKDSRVIAALLNAAENGKHVSVLFEVKARFDEENNMREAKRLQDAGCFVIYGIGSLKTHTKLLLIVRKEKDKIRRYVHMSSGNYNESTARMYTDIGFMTTDESYANDVQEFFNVITGHSFPNGYENLITAPREMRSRLIQLIENEEKSAQEGKVSGIVIKINTLQDMDTIYALYSASQAGVPIHLIVRGTCCLRPARKGLSENISVRSIVGDYLEHSRIYYFHNNGNPYVYSGSADIMVRSFDRRLESLFIIKDELLKQQVINMLANNLKDNVNAYQMNEDGTYSSLYSVENTPFNIHEEFYNVRKEKIKGVKLFG